MQQPSILLSARVDAASSSRYMQKPDGWDPLPPPLCPCNHPANPRATSPPLGVQVNDDDDEDLPALSFAFARDSVFFLPLL